MINVDNGNKILQFTSVVALALNLNIYIHISIQYIITHDQILSSTKCHFVSLLTFIYHIYTAFHNSVVNCQRPTDALSLCVTMQIYNKPPFAYYTYELLKSHLLKYMNCQLHSN